MKVVDMRGYGLMKSDVMMLCSFETSVRVYQDMVILMKITKFLGRKFPF